MLPCKIDRPHEGIGQEPEEVYAGFCQGNFLRKSLFFEWLDQVIAINLKAANLGKVVSSDKQNFYFQPLFSFASFKPHLADLL